MAGLESWSDVPRGHSAQTLALLEEKYPVGHFTQSLPSTLKRPMGQASHDASVRDGIVPLPQAPHGVPSGLYAVFPISAQEIHSVRSSAGCVPGPQMLQLVPLGDVVFRSTPFTFIGLHRSHLSREALGCFPALQVLQNPPSLIPVRPTSEHDLQIAPPSPNVP